MRILQVNSARAWGGGETHVAGLTAGLRSHGHEVMTAGRAAGAISPDFKLPFRNAFDAVTAVRLRAILRGSHFDIIHAHLARDYPLACAAAMGARGTRVVCTRHLLYTLRKHPFYRRVNGWIAPTGQIERTLHRLRPRNTAIIPNGIAMEKFPFRRPAFHSPLVLGILGQISPHKGHADALAALRELGPNYRLAIAGQGREDDVRALKTAARGLAVEFHDFTPAESFFQEIDILLAPSWEEPFGMVALEAMAAGVPVVATGRGGPAEIITSGSDGMLAPPREPSALAAAVRTLASDPEGTRELALRARRRVETSYTLDAMVARVEEFYLRLLAE